MAPILRVGAASVTLAAALGACSQPAPLTNGAHPHGEDGPEEAAYTFMPKETLRKVEHSVFEVVVPKQHDDFVVYERPLPLGKLPYQIRNDKYVGLGTAFSIGGNRYVSAAHVFHLETRTLRKDFSLRDGDGNVYRIGQVHKYSNDRDLIEFDLAEPIANDVPLEISDQVDVGDAVFTAGDALGEGISYRGGQVASFTPEDIDGRWKNIRFSAPASPGNSGGPLLNSKGEVVGVVARKNSTENFNVATPISELAKLSESKAEFFQKHVEFKRGTKIVDHEWHYEARLPQPIDKLRGQAEEACRKFELETFEELKKGKNVTDFPDSPAFREYLTRQGYHPNFSYLASDGTGGNWKIEQVKTSTVDVGDQQRVAIGKVRAVLYAIVEKPSNLSLRIFVRSPKLIMDAIVKAANFSKTVGDEKIRVVSYGEPAETESWTDGLGRRWDRSTWYFNEPDSFLSTECHPIPVGEACMVYGGPVALLTYPTRALAENSMAEEMISYAGTVKQWKEYLGLGSAMVPPVLADGRVELSDGKLKAEFSGVSATFSDAGLSEKSSLGLKMGYSPDEREALEILRFQVNPWEERKAGMEIVVSHAPQTGGQKEKREFWEQETKREAPFDGNPFLKGDYNRINFVLEDTGKGASAYAKSAHLFLVECWNESHDSQDSLVKTCRKFKDGVSLK